MALIVGVLGLAVVGGGVAWMILPMGPATVTYGTVVAISRSADEKGDTASASVSLADGMARVQLARGAICGPGDRIRMTARRSRVGTTYSASPWACDHEGM